MPGIGTHRRQQGDRIEVGKARPVLIAFQGKALAGRVIGSDDLIDDHRDALYGGWPRLRICRMLRPHVGLAGGGVLGAGRPEIAQQCWEIVWVHLDAPPDGFPGGGEDRDCGPAAAAVAGVQRGVVVAVGKDADVVCLEDGLAGGVDSEAVQEALAVGTPGRADDEEDETFIPPGGGEGRLRERLPVDRRFEEGEAAEALIHRDLPSRQVPRPQTRTIPRPSTPAPVV